MLDFTSNLPAILISLRNIVAEYDAKTQAIPELIAKFKEAVTTAELGSCIAGTYARDIWGRSTPSLSETTMQSSLLQSGWRRVYAGLNIDKVAPASDRSRFELTFHNPPPLTLDNIRATFGKYILDRRYHILRGLAECFSELDPAFKSHDKMKIGVKGLPKRIILTSVDDYGQGYGSAKMRDTINAMRVFNGLPHVEYAEFSHLLKSARKGDGLIDNLTLRRFANGNGHLIFSAEALRQVNEALAEFYGDVLPDCPEAGTDCKQAKSTAVSKDLQFYRTPASVADRLVGELEPQDGTRILEPSCGDGAILDALRRYAEKNRISLRAVGIEYDAARAEDARAKGYSVQVANFLQIAPSPEFDYVVMNPPFYGKHYQQHVEHARKFLKPNGRLLAILPVTAVTDHGFVKADRWQRERWTDLPVGSFSESGTNINTGIARFYAA
jgi:hypothetical protein